MDNVYQYALGVVALSAATAWFVMEVRRWWEEAKVARRERTRERETSVPARVVMAERDVRAGLAVSAGHPVFRAVLAVLDEKIALASVQVSDPNLVKTEAGALPVVHTAGGLEWLRDVRDELESLRKNAETTENAEIGKGGGQ